MQATGARLALIIQDISCVGAALVIGFVFSWMLTFGILAFIPFVLGAALVQMKMLGGMAKRGHAALEDASKVIKFYGNERVFPILTKRQVESDPAFAAIAQVLGRTG